MKGIFQKAVSKVADAVRRGTDDTLCTGRVSGTVYILTGALVGALLAGFAGAIIGGVIVTLIRGYLNSLTIPHGVIVVVE